MSKEEIPGGTWAKPASITLRNARSREERAFELVPLDFGDLIDAESCFGDVYTLFLELAQLRASAVQAFYWLMLSRCVPALTLEQAGEWIPLVESEWLEAMLVLGAATGLCDAASAPAMEAAA